MPPFFLPLAALTRSPLYPAPSMGRTSTISGGPPASEAGLGCKSTYGELHLISAQNGPLQNHFFCFPDDVQYALTGITQTMFG
jgi:hypothetical protein